MRNGGRCRAREVNRLEELLHRILRRSPSELERKVTIAVARADRVLAHRAAITNEDRLRFIEAERRSLGGRR